MPNKLLYAAWNPGIFWRKKSLATLQNDWRNPQPSNRPLHGYGKYMNLSEGNSVLKLKQMHLIKQEITIILIIDPKQAYAATALLADRMCIATNGSFNQLLSIEEVVSCSGENFYKFVREHRAYEFFKRHGVVSGGKYNTNVVIF